MAQYHADRCNSSEGNGDDDPPRALFNRFEEGRKKRRFSNIAESMQGGSPGQIIEGRLGHLAEVDPIWAVGERRAVNTLSRQKE